MATGHYFRSPENWTLDREEAFDFGLAAKALKVAQKLRIRELELVLSLDDCEEAAETPFGAFLRGLSRNGKRHAAGGRPSRRSVAA